MVATYIDTHQCPRITLADARGAVAEIVNQNLCGAQNVVGRLRWLGAGEGFAAEALNDRHQLIYLMAGAGVVTLENKEYEVSKGAGIYLGPRETVSIRQAGNAALKLFHLVVAQVRD